MNSPTRIAIVDSALRLPLADLAAEEIVALHAALRVRNPEALRASPFVHVPAWIDPIEIDDDTIILPRGSTNTVRRLVPGVRFADCRLAVPHEFIFSGDLRPYQARAAAALIEREQGIVVAPCGSGKTEILLATVARAGQRAIVVVPTLDLVAQWVDRARARLGVEAAVFADGQREVGPLTIATVQSLAMLDPVALAELAASFGLVGVDEAHHVAAESYRAVLGAFAARFRMGATATLDRSDGLTPLVHQLLGDVVASVRHDELEADGHTLVPRYVQVRSAFVFAYEDPDDWADLLAALVTDEARNRTIVDLATAEAADGPGLVLTGRVQHARDLAHAIAARGVRAAALVGDMTRRDRARVLDDVRSGKLDVLVATSLADEGLDVPCLSWLVLAFPSRAAGRHVQRIGRILRPAPGKREPSVFDLVDERVGVLAHQGRVRERIWRQTWGRGSTARVA